MTTILVVLAALIALNGLGVLLWVCAIEWSRRRYRRRRGGYLIGPHGRSRLP